MPDLHEQLKLKQPNPETSPTGCRLLLKRGRNYDEAVEALMPHDRTVEVRQRVRRASVTSFIICKNLTRPPGLTLRQQSAGNALATIDAILALLGENDPDDHPQIASIL